MVQKGNGSRSKLKGKQKKRKEVEGTKETRERSF